MLANATTKSAGAHRYRVMKWHRRIANILINRENALKGVRALLLRAVYSFSKRFPWHLAHLESAGARLHFRWAASPLLVRLLIANRLLESECRELPERTSPCC